MVILTYLLPEAGDAPADPAVVAAAAGDGEVGEGIVPGGRGRLCVMCMRMCVLGGARALSRLICMHGHTRAGTRHAHLSIYPFIYVSA